MKNELLRTYSVIIPYRDREEHLKVLIPALHNVLKDNKFEIIIAEQDDDQPFQKHALFNLASRYAKNNFLVFHDVDYIPNNDVSYDQDIDTTLFPLRKSNYVDNENTPLPRNEIPDGYKDFNLDVGQCSGGIWVLSKELFKRINGFNPLYKGWGREDDDTRERLKLLGYKWKRNQQGTFNALPHETNSPPPDDLNFKNNINQYLQLFDNLKVGEGNTEAKVKVIKNQQPKVHHIFIKNIKIK